VIAKLLESAAKDRRVIDSSDGAALNGVITVSQHSAVSFIFVLAT